ncbi:MAG: D-alanyl-D-alanine carboxypeptidase/D-alanyl-D-alanine-endopeptidase [Candidatus Korobacteraceae bacterium]
MGKTRVVLTLCLLAASSSWAAAETKAPQESAGEDTKTPQKSAVGTKPRQKSAAATKTPQAAATTKTPQKSAPEKKTPPKEAAPKPAALAERIRQITNRREFKQSLFGIEFLDLESGKVLFALNGEKLFVPGSTTKLVTEGTALALLGPDYRFSTRVYRTGSVSGDGTLEGDLVLVAGGDPNLSARVRDDDTLSFTSFDHGYAGSMPGVAVPGDPLTVLKDMARQVAEHGIKQVRGQVLVDTSLFTAERAEPGTGAIISPIMVNDNMVDVTVFGGAQQGEPTGAVMAPLAPYLTVSNKATTGKAGSNADLRFTAETVNPDGSYTVSIEGSVPAGEQALASYKVKSPRRFAESAFWVALQSVGVQAPAPSYGPRRDFKLLASWYTSENLVAEHISPPFAAEAKVTLKTSQNLHASTTPYLLGALLAQRPDAALQAGFELERKFLAKAGLDLKSVSQADGEGGPGAAFTPDFMVRYLAYMAKQQYAEFFIDALPVMGRDGTLQAMQQKSPAAGHVRAKTGTYVYYDGLNRGLLLLGKGLVGYIETRHRHKLAFAVYVNQVHLANIDEVENVGDLLGQIANAAYDLL